MGLWKVQRVGRVFRALEVLWASLHIGCLMVHVGSFWCAQGLITTKGTRFVNYLV